MILIDGLVGVMRDLNVHEDKIQKVIDALDDGQTDLSDGSFDRNARIAPSSFGGAPSGQDLGFHHSRAQQVIADTIRGVTADLEAFRDGVHNAVRLVTAADEASADDLNRKREIAESLSAVWVNSQGDRANRESRNENLTGGGDA
jgi:hypothetical protein